MHRSPWSRDETYLPVFSVSGVWTLTIFFGRGFRVLFFLNAASVGGCRRMSAEERCTEFRARASQANLKTQLQRQHEITCTYNELTMTPSPSAGNQYHHVKDCGVADHGKSARGAALAER